MASVMLRVTLVVEHEPLLAPVLGHEGEAARHRDAAGCPSAAPGPSSVHGARLVGVDPEDRPGDLAAAGSDEPREADDLAGRAR